jgi:hypothetical protein
MTVLPSEFPALERSKAAEYGALAALLCITFLLWVTTLAWTPIGPDEPSYKDPAINVVLGNGFTSGAWYGQASTEFWAGNTPLHAFVQIPWFAAFGISLLTSRTLEWSLILGATWILYVAVSRLGLVPSTKARLLFTAAWLGQTSTYTLATHGRPDALGLFIVALVLLAWSANNKRFRLPALAVLSSLLPWSGLQMIVAVLLVLSPLALVFRARFAAEIIAVFTGMAMGGFGLVIFYHLNDALSPFIDSVVPHTAMGGLSIHTYNGWTRGKSFWFLLLGAACLLFGALQKAFRTKSCLSPTIILAGYFAFAFPIALFLGGKFTTNYIWIPALGYLLALFHLFSTTAFIRRSFLNASVLGFTTLSAIYGPTEIAMIALANDSTNVHGRVAAYTAAHVDENDCVVYSQFAFYPAKTSASRAFYANWYGAAITPEEKLEVTLLLCSPEWAHKYESILGSRWVPVDAGIKIPIFRFLRPPLIESLIAHRRAVN